MKDSNWFTRIKKLWIEKQKDRIRKKYGFLFDDYKNEQIILFQDIESKIETITLSNNQLLEKITDSLEEQTELFCKQISELDDSIKACKEKVTENRTEANDALSEMSKIIKRLNQNCLENQTTILKEVEELLRLNDRMQLLLEEKTNVISTDVEGVQALLRIVAINDLIGDFDKLE